MKMTWLTAACGAWLTTSAAAQSCAPEIPFDSVANFLKLPPDRYLGEVAGIALNSKKHIFVLSRGNTTGPAYGAAAAQLYRSLRKFIMPYADDRPLATDIAAAIDFLRREPPHG